jgi:hypothetical protein
LEVEMKGLRGGYEERLLLKREKHAAEIADI